MLSWRKRLWSKRGQTLQSSSKAWIIGRRSRKEWRTMKELEIQRLRKMLKRLKRTEDFFAMQKNIFDNIDSLSMSLYVHNHKGIKYKAKRHEQKDICHCILSRQIFCCISSGRDFVTPPHADHEKPDMIRSKEKWKSETCD